MASYSIEGGPRGKHEFAGIPVEVSSTSSARALFGAWSWDVRLKASVAPRRRWTSLWLLRKAGQQVERLTLETGFAPDVVNSSAEEMFIDGVTARDAGEVSLSFPLPVEYDEQAPWWKRLLGRRPLPCTVAYRLSIADKGWKETFRGQLTITFPDTSPASSF